ncbi:MAG: hypothetical protein AAGN82_26335 [Myxococcota bacterium]
MLHLRVVFRWLVALSIAFLFAPGASATERRTRFKPEVHGFNFSNSFQNDVAFDIRTGGLCGGMSYAALDYFQTRGRSVPRQDFRPANRTPLQSYLYRRQLDTFRRTAGRWADMGINPRGSRNHKLFHRALGSEFRRVRSSIDRGVPIVLGLHGADASSGQHQVLAIGYKTGPGKAVQIYVYDPNEPNKTLTMKADLRNKYFWHVSNGRRKSWRSFFADTTFRRTTPPAVAMPRSVSRGQVRDLVVHAITGEDDLRGGKSNVNLIVHLDGGQRLTRNNINLGARWLRNYDEHAHVVLPRSVALSSIRRIQLQTTSRGGIGGDNWDLSRVAVQVVEGGRRRAIVNRTAFHRFTGSRRDLYLDVPRSTPSAAGKVSTIKLTLGTGNDDLRGNEDNVDATVLFRDGSRQTIRTINRRRRWADRTSHSVDLQLSRPRRPGDIIGVLLRTTSRGGTSGDNWNLDRLRVEVAGRSRYDRSGRPLKRFTSKSPTFSARLR